MAKVVKFFAIIAEEDDLNEIEFAKTKGPDCMIVETATSSVMGIAETLEELAGIAAVELTEDDSEDDYLIRVGQMENGASIYTRASELHRMRDIGDGH